MAKTDGTAKADTAVKLVLMFFISLLSFSVGTYVGKQFSDSESRRAALEADYHSDEDAVATTHETKAEGDEATAPVSDEEVSSLTEEFVKKERGVASDEHKDAPATESTEHADPNAKIHDGYTHRSKMNAAESESVVNQKDNRIPSATKSTLTEEKVSPPHDAKPEPTQVKHEPKSVSNAAERVSHDMAPAADPQKVKAPSTALPTVATSAIGKYTVQVASYATEAEAKDHASKLTGKGYSAFFIPATVNGKSWYRVSVGLFSDQKSATTFRTELIATHAVPTAIVQKIVK